MEAILATANTTEITAKQTRKREFDIHRSIRLHWVKFHIKMGAPDNIVIFSCLDPEGKRTYIHDKQENYVIVLEPKRNLNQYYLLTAFYIRYAIE